MLDLNPESVAQSASNTFVVFCFCNLLIVIILMSPNPSSSFKERSQFCLPIVTHKGHNSLMDEHRIDIEQPPKDEETTPEVMELCIWENLAKEGRNYNSEGEADNGDDSESNNDNNDEFRRRIEAFIDKVNREWKAEKLRTRYLCEQVDFCEPSLY